MDYDAAGFRPLHGSYLTCAKSALITAVLLIFLPTISLANAQSQAMIADASGTVEGRITCNDGGFPARSAGVDLIPLATLLGSAIVSKVSDPQKLMASTDFDGSYSIRSVPAGDYLVVAHLAGYSVDFALVLQLLKLFPPDRQKELLAAFPRVTVRPASVARQDVVMHRGAAVSGRVTFDSGGNLEESFVRATLISSDLLGSDQRSEPFKPVDLPHMRGMTDDRGIFRIAGLSPGKYRISVVINHHGGGAVAGPLIVYASDAITETKSRLVQVGEGDEISDVDITIPLRSLHSIGGMVMRSGVPVPGAHITILGKGSEIESDTSTLPDGTYRYDLLPPGTYTIGTQDFPLHNRIKANSTDPTITIQIGETDVLDANLDLPNNAPAK